MKKFTSASAFLIGISAITASAIVAIPVTDSPNIQSEDTKISSLYQSSRQAIIASPAKIVTIPEIGWVTVYEEDFSGMSAGTHDNPDEVQLANESSILPAEYVSNQSGWTGFGIYQAGGACALNCPQFGGFINTPETAMTGLIRVSFRLFSLDPIGTGKVTVCRGGILNPRQVDREASIRQFDTDGWQDFECVFYNPNPDNVFVQINTVYASAEKKGIVIDDLKVEYNPTYVAPIKSVSTLAYNNDGFSVQWIPTQSKGDLEYLVSLYKQETVGDNISADQDFSTWKTDAQGKLAESVDGWKIVKTYPNHPALYEIDGNQGLIIGHHDEIIELPSNGGCFTELSFDIVNLKGDNEKAWGSQIQVLGWNGNDWEKVMTVGTSGMDNNANRRIDLGAWEDAGPDMYDPTIPAFRGLYSKIRLECESANYGAMMLIDNVHYETLPASETVCVKKDEVVTTDLKEYSGLDMANTYTVGIKTKDGENVSGETFITPYGIGEPLTLEATEITTAGYTANWQPVAHAQSYILTSYDCELAKESDENFKVVSADLIGLSVGSDDYDQPVNIGNNYELNDLSEYIAEGWVGAGNIAVNDAIGCRDSYFPGMYGILSPELHLGNDNGHVTFKANVWGRAFSSISIGTTNGEAESEMFETDGLREITIEIDNCNNHDSIAIFSTDGQQFYIKDFTISQKINEGDLIILSSNTVELPGNTSSYLIEEPEIDNHARAYDVAAYRKDFTREALSLYSPLQKVGKTQNGVSEVNDENIKVNKVENIVTINIPQLSTIEIYSIDGKLIHTAQCESGTYHFALPSHGLYLVRIGDYCCKVLY